MKKQINKQLASLLAALLILSSCSGESVNSYGEAQSTTERAATTSMTEETTTESKEQNTVTSEASTLTHSEDAETTVTTAEITTVANAISQATTPPPEVSGDMIVHFIDVGQGDSIFIEFPNSETMLIDAGETDQGSNVSSYIFSQGYDTIDHVVATHPHSDHIGGIPEVLETFNIGTFYMTEATSTSSIFELTLDKVSDSGADTQYVMAGDIIIDSGELLCEVVAPKSIDNDELNNNSIVIKLTYGENKFLFTGDAEKSEEDGIWTNIKCDVLKVGHHGSDSSTSSNFLKKVEPKYALISCGLGNSYGHPTDEVLKKAL